MTPRHDDPELLRVVAEAVDMETYYRQLLEPVFHEEVELWRLYHGEYPDLRGPHEQWRADVHMPYPYSLGETCVASLIEVLDGADPQVQPDPVFEQDELIGKPVQRLIDYTLRANRWPSLRELLMRDVVISGTGFLKIAWGKRARNTWRRVSQDDVVLFLERVKAAEQATGVQAPTDDYQAFQAWRGDVNAAYPALQVPDLPVAGPQKMLHYAGPELRRVNKFDLRFDPLSDDMQTQDCFIHRLVKPASWVRRMAHPDNPDRLFDLEAVEAAGGAADPDRFSIWQREVADMLGLQADSATDPRYMDATELWEVWRPQSDYPYAVVMNRSRVINLDPETTPNASGRIPFYPIRNIAVGGHLLGVSELKPPKKLFYEMDSLRGLRLDAVTLAVLPIFLRLADAGFPEVQRFFQPGSIIDVKRLDGLAQLLKYPTGIMEAFRELAEIKGDIDESAATFPQVRGAGAGVGRVSATESERRVSQALQRTKTKVLRIEDELTQAVEEVLVLWHQHGDARLRVAAGGGDPLITIDRDKLVQALEMNFRFRGATKTLDRDLTAQQLMGWFKTFGAVLSPKGVIAVARRTYETMNLKGAEQVLGDALEYQAQIQAQQAQQQALQAQAGAGGAPPGPPPEQGGPPPDGGGGELPPGGEAAA